MKLKILVVPILIAGVIGFVIWMVIPMAKDIAAKKQALEKSKIDLVEIQKKNLNAGKLDSDFTANAEKWSVLMKFIPYKREDENIINNLNYLATDTGVALKLLDVSQSSVGSAPAIVDRDSENLSQPQKISAAISITGSYGKIKLFLEKVNKLERYSRCSSLKISKAEETEQNFGTDDLSADAVLDFAYMKKDDSVDVSSNEGVFSNSAFNFSAVNSIQEKMKTGLISLQVGETGKSNPFAPLN